MKRSVNHALAAAVLGIGLAGGVAMAQAPTATTGSGTATTQAPSGASTTQNQPGPAGQPGHMGPQGWGPGGPGRPGGPGGGQAQAPTTASVTTEISNLTTTLTSVKADSDFANGKMDLTTVTALINQATVLQTQAQTALTANNLTLASGDARAAESALRSADDLIIASIGTTGLPSAANRPARPTPTTPTTTPTADQEKARSSNELARAFQQIVDAGKTVTANNGSAAGDLSFYITTAQTLYKQAYDLYNAGKYDQASQTVRAAGNVAGIAGELLRAAGVTPAGPQVVPVPAPTF